MSPPAPRRLLLTGFMGAGKTSVGRVLADALGWRFEDFDAVVEREAGMSISRIFQIEGEAGFRSREDAVAKRLLAEERIVLASGGGWAAATEQPLEPPQGTLTIWLRVSAGEVVRRLAGADVTRPLLSGPGARTSVSALLSDREPRYRRARWTVDTDGLSVEDVSARILERLSSEYPETRSS